MDATGARDVNDFVNALSFIGHHRSLLLTKIGEHLLLSSVALAIALVIAVPLGLWLGHVHRGSFIAITAANVGRALPSLAVIAILLAPLGVGFTTNMIALVVLAVPPILTNAYVAIDGVDRDAVEAARGMGMHGRDVLTRVELPLGLPLLFAGVRTAAVYVVATATLAGIAGGGGLGDIIVDQASYRLEGVLGAAICVAMLALAVELLFAGLQRAVTPAGLRLNNEAAPAIGPATIEGGT
jgi:osmoprotectant transport system permease protein